MYEKLISWSKETHKDLPWRVNRTLYTTLVSEIMLQQTTVQTVLNHYDRFLKVFPTIKSLAIASEEELTFQWKGLGYYRRARNLRSACIEIVEKYQGNIPLDYDKLISIKGIGEYTANALLSIGANRKALAIDANLERVLARIYGIKTEKGPKLQKDIKSKFKEERICTKIVQYESRDFNEALMDLGREFCKANKYYCELCPMNKSCISFEKNIQDMIPVNFKEKKISKYYDLKLLRVICIKDNRILAYKKNNNEWLSLQYEIPTFTLFSEDEHLKQYPKIKAPEHLFLLPMIKTSITKYRIENYILIFDINDFEKLNIEINDFEWIDLNDNSNLSTASYKALDFLNKK